MNQNRRYIPLGIAVFLTAAAIMLFYDTLFGTHVLLAVFEQFFSAFTPIIIGAFMAYMLAPLVNFVESLFFFVSVRRAKRLGKLSQPAVRAVSVFLVWAVVSVVVVVLLMVLLPELYRSFVQLAGNMQNYYNTINGWITLLFERFPEAETWINERLSETYTQIDTYIRSALDQVQTIMAAAGRGVLNVVNFLKNLLVGVIVSVYLLSTKEHLAASCKRLLCSLFSADGVQWILRGTHKVDQIFSGFVRGKLLDSLIIGILCFFGCVILDFPYTPLISVFVGVTNIIPFFGPFIGAVPSVFLILLSSPIKALYFTVFILALQQLDGNIIGPKILGDQTGLSSLWVIVAILVGGSFFGIPGMFFGVPVLACIYSAGSFIIEQRLIRRRLPLEVSAYTRKFKNGHSMPENRRIKDAEKSADTRKRRRDRQKTV